MTWDELEAEVRAEMQVRSGEPIAYGQRVLWTTVVGSSRTDGLSLVHRVADLDGERYIFDGHTFCGVTIPPEGRRLPLGIARVLSRCMTCEIACARAREEAIEARLRAAEAIRWPA